MKISPDEVLAGIPGWEGAIVSELTGGLSNNTWRVVQGRRVGVLKIDVAARELPFNTRCAEAYIQNTAAKAGLAANVILADDRMYFTEFVEGTVWNRDSFAREGNLELLAVALKQLHGLPLTGKSFDATVAARRYVEESTGLDSGIAAQCTEVVSGMRLPQNLCCCHNDLVAENLIAAPNLMFLDWEYACDNDPFFDLATVVEHHELSDWQVEKMLDVYFDGDGMRWWNNLEKQRKLYLALLCLWMAARPDRNPAEIRKIAARLATSCS